MSDTDNSVRLPAFAAALPEGVCFDCYVARLLIVSYNHYTEGLGYSHKRTASFLGLDRASLYSRIRRAHTRIKNCPTCQTTRPQRVHPPRKEAKQQPAGRRKAA